MTKIWLKLNGILVQRLKLNQNLLLKLTDTTLIVLRYLQGCKRGGTFPVNFRTLSKNPWKIPKKHHGMFPKFTGNFPPFCNPSYFISWLTLMKRYMNPLKLKFFFFRRDCGEIMCLTLQLSDPASYLSSL